MIVREQLTDDYEAIRHVYAEAFRRPRFRPPQNPGCIPLEVGLFEALWEAGDAIPEFSFTALTDCKVVGHVTASQATSPPTQLLPWGRLASFRIIKAPASGAR